MRSGPVSMRLLAAVGACILALLLAGCTEKTTVEIKGNPIDVTGSDEFPDGNVALDDRPANPPTSFNLACPWGEVETPPENPYLLGALLPDAIPAVDDPVWLPVRSPDLGLIDTEPVIAVEVGGNARAMPIRILLHHEIVNICWDTASGSRFTYLTYCPLVDAAVHYTDPRLCTAKKKFGVSGALYNGNLITFDRSTAREGQTPEDLFVQLYGGGLFGSCAAADPGALYMSWAMFKRLFPDGEVLSADTGHVPLNGYDLFNHPYADYWGKKEVWFPVRSTDNRVAQFGPVFGVLVEGGRKAYPLKREPFVINDILAGQNVTVWYDAGFSGVAAYEAVHDGATLTFSLAGRERHGLPIYVDDETGSHWNFEAIAVAGPLTGARLPRLMGIRTFWFAWSSMYPDGELHEPQS